MLKLQGIHRGVHSKNSAIRPSAVRAQVNCTIRDGTDGLIQPDGEAKARLTHVSFFEVGPIRVHGMIEITDGPIHGIAEREDKA